MNTTAKQVIGPALSAVIVAGAVIGASSIAITVAAPAQADACSQWGFPNGGNGFDTGWGGSLQFNAAGKSVSQAAASWLGGPGGSGYLNGSLSGTGVSFTWKGDGGPPNFSGGATITFSGTVDNDGSAHGTAMNGDKITTFTSQKRLVCLDAPPVAPPPVVAPPAATPSATVNADTDLYDKPSDQGGHKIGVLNEGQVVKVVSACSSDAWCTLTSPKGAAWGRDLTNN